MADAQTGRIRLDKWLWASRFYKTRGLAQAAIDAGHVSLNGDRAKPAHAVKVGDRVGLRLNQLEYALTIRAVSDKRGSATIARELYEESAESIARREERLLQLKAEHATFPYSERRPTKKARREIDRYRRVD